MKSVRGRLVGLCYSLSGQHHLELTTDRCNPEDLPVVGVPTVTIILLWYD